MNPIAPRALSLLVLAAALPAQDAGLTLAELLRRAPSVVVARCTQVQEGGGVRRADFVRLELLAGQEPGERLALSERAEVRCGSTLHAAAPGASFVLFLADVPATALLGGARGLEPLAAGLVEHLRALASASDDVARVRLLAAALGTGATPRVQRDAARTLLLTPQLETLADAGVRAGIGSALLTDPELRAPAGLDLLQTGARLALPTALTSSVQLYVSGSRPELDRLLTHTVQTFAPAAVAGQVVSLRPTNARGQERQVALLAPLPGTEAALALQQLAGQAQGAPRIAALAALLLRGAPLPGAVADDELAAAQSQAARTASAAPRFRNVRPPGR